MPSAVKPSPMVCANRFGGPGTCREWNSGLRRVSTDSTRGVANRVTNCPSWRQRRPGGHPGEEAVGERHQHPPLADDEEHERLEHDDGRHEASRRLVDGIREARTTDAPGEDIADKPDQHSRELPGGSTRRVRNRHRIRGDRAAPVPRRARCRQAGTVGDVTIRLTVRTALWRAHVARVVNDVDGLVPVVKGNGYGFGRLDAGTARIGVHRHRRRRHGPRTRRAARRPARRRAHADPRRADVDEPDPHRRQRRPHRCPRGLAGPSTREARVVDAAVRSRSRADRRARRAGLDVVGREHPPATRRHQRRTPA